MSCRGCIANRRRGWAVLRTRNAPQPVAIKRRPSRQVLVAGSHRSTTGFLASLLIITSAVPESAPRSVLVFIMLASRVPVIMPVVEKYLSNHKATTFVRSISADALIVALQHGWGATRSGVPSVRAGRADRATCL